jgi:hypothetical protein
MNDWKLVLSGMALLLAPLSGLGLRRPGRPLNGPLFAVHKLLAVALVILAALLLRDMLRGKQVAPLLLVLLLIAGLAALALFVSGALLSALKAPSGWLLPLHRLATVLLCFSLPLLLYLARFPGR